MTKKRKREREKTEREREKQRDRERNFRRYSNPQIRNTACFFCHM
jgi:hypothetical protein